MGLEQDYRKYAGHSLELARKQPNSADKRRLLVMAEAWLDLADRIAGRAKRSVTVDHPLVEQALGPSSRPSH